MGMNGEDFIFILKYGKHKQTLFLKTPKPKPEAKL